MTRVTILNGMFSSFRRRPESSNFKHFWTPAFAGVTTCKVELAENVLTLALMGLGGPSSP